MISIVTMPNIRHMEPLSNALNKAGIYQKIDLKRSDYLEYSRRQTNHSSIFGITTMASHRACTRQGMLSLRVARVLRGRACHASMADSRNSTILVG